ncbi:MAG: ubiquinol-cytochrome c reductase cytochrome b subunit, partial [Myxococcota bacterium]
MSLGERVRAFAAAVDDRTGLGKAIAFVNDHQVFGGARFAYAFGSALVFVFILQVVTGIALGTTYSPSVTDAWGSVHYIQHHMTMGAFVRGVHHFGSSAMIVLCVLHMTQVLMFGAHRKPREANWVLGVVMLLLVLAFGLTGYLLPWDQKGYWATQVATGIIGGTPGGELLQTVIQGGTEYGNATLTRFYALHVLVLPPTMFFLMVGHIALFYRHGVKRSPRAERVKPARPSVTFWPYQLLRDVVVAAIVFGILAALALLVGVGLDAPADASSNYEARPEWYFLFLFQLLKFFEGPLTI